MTLAPENTIAAFDLALAQGADMIELDIHPTKDGRFAVVHDVTVDRTTNGSGCVQDLSAAQIQELIVSEPSDSARRIPMLDEVLSWAKGRAYLNIDVRNYPALPFYDIQLTAERIIQALTDAGVLGQVIVQCLDHRLAVAVRSRCEDVVVGITQHGRPAAPAVLAHAAGANFMSIDAAFATKEFVASLHEQGIGVMTSVELRLPGLREESTGKLTSRLVDLLIDVLVADDVDATATLVASLRDAGKTGE